jgi:hypothetical protein
MEAHGELPAIRHRTGRSSGRREAKIRVYERALKQLPLRAAVRFAHTYKQNQGFIDIYRSDHFVMEAEQDR